MFISIQLYFSKMVGRTLCSRQTLSIVDYFILLLINQRQFYSLSAFRSSHIRTCLACAVLTCTAFTCTHHTPISVVGNLKTTFYKKVDNVIVKIMFRSPARGNFRRLHAAYFTQRIIMNCVAKH